MDLLVDLDPDRTLMDLGGLLMDLQELLRVRVDVATEAMLRPHVRKRVLADAIPLRGMTAKDWLTSCARSIRCSINRA